MASLKTSSVVARVLSLIASSAAEGVGVLKGQKGRHRRASLSFHHRKVNIAPALEQPSNATGLRRRVRTLGAMSVSLPEVPALKLVCHTVVRSCREGKLVNTDQGSHRFSRNDSDNP